MSGLSLQPTGPTREMSHRHQLGVQRHQQGVDQASHRHQQWDQGMEQGMMRETGMGQRMGMGGTSLQLSHFCQCHPHPLSLRDGTESGWQA